MLAALAGACLGQIRPLLADGVDRRTRLALAPILEGAARTVEEVLPDAHRLTLRIHKRLPDIRVDADAFHHLLVMLMIGASTAAATRRVRLRISTGIEGSRVRVCVSDDGPPLDALPTRARPGRRGRELWVSVADAILSAGGGRVRVTPSRRGTRVDLLLPAVRSPARRASDA